MYVEGWDALRETSVEAWRQVILLGRYHCAPHLCAYNERASLISDSIYCFTIMGDVLTRPGRATSRSESSRQHIFQVGLGVLGLPGGREGGIQHWWKEIREFLEIRKGAGALILRIDIEGKEELCQRAIRTKTRDAEASECHSYGFIQQIVERKSGRNVCVVCDSTTPSFCNH